VPSGTRTSTRASNLIDTVFLEKLDELRERCGFPFVISSGYRCPTHNAAVSSTGKSGPHTTGRAADIAVSHGQAFTVLAEALQMGFTGIGVQQKGGSRFIHLDMLPNGPGQPRPTVWSYG
jgi:zinc D-Ala-D-Ala carboxypeptidase